MKTHHILIDIENVCPRNVGELKDKNVKIYVFYGFNQKIPECVENALDSLGNKVERIYLLKAGNNAADFHLTFYLGTIINKYKKDCYHIVSKDKGYDTLIHYLTSNRVYVQRDKRLYIEQFKKEKTKYNNPKTEKVIKLLNNLNTSKPKKVKGFFNVVRSSGLEIKAEEKIQKILNNLKKQGYITTQGNNIIYN